MSGHISSESLSAYLDGEVGPAEEQRLAAHLAACVPCRRRLAAARQLVGGLRRLAQEAPPPELAALVRARVAAEAGDLAGMAGADGAADQGAWLESFESSRSSGTSRPSRSSPAAESWRPRPSWRSLRRRLRSFRSWTWWQGLPPLRGSFGAARPLVTAGLALLVAALLLQHGENGGAGLASLVPKLPHAGPEFLVSEAFGDAPAVLPQTTSEVAGRVFVWSDDVWVQRGVDAGPAGQARTVPARSPAGRELLAKFSDLGVLLADGSRVVLRYNYETVELSNGS
jgi:anti-sigma factor RsiW